MQYNIPRANLSHLRKRIEKISRKAEKLGCEPVTLTEGETFTTVKLPGQDAFNTTSTEKIEEASRSEGASIRTYTKVTVEGAAPQIKGWTLIAALDHKSHSETIVKTTVDDLPVKYRQHDGSCDHCQTNRRRNDTYVLRNDAGETKAVGRQCLKDFLGYNDPQKVAEWQTFHKIVDICRDAEEWGWAGERVNPEIGLERFLAQTSACVRKNGWVSRGAARNIPEYTATADTAWGQFFLSPEQVAKGIKIHTDEKDIKVARDTIQHIPSREVRSDFDHNLSVALKDDFVTYATAGIVASAISVYQRWQEAEIKKAVEAARREARPSSHIGEAKQRLDLGEVTLVHKSWHDSQWGSTALHRFEDTDGNVIIWWASDSGSAADVLEQGDTAHVTATVKKHDDYKGTPQTVVTRLTIHEEAA